MLGVTGNHAIERDDVSLVQHQTQLLAALKARDMDCFLQLLQQSSIDADSSCLEAACRQPDAAEFVRVLLQYGGDPNSLNPVLQETPLHIAAELGHDEVLEVLLHDTRINMNALNGSGQTALHVAAQSFGEINREKVGNLRQCMTLLLEWPSNVHMKHGTREALHVVDVNAADWLGNTALHYAVQNKDQDAILQLLQCGSYIGARNHSGKMPLSSIDSQTLQTFCDKCLKMPSDDSVLFKYDFLVPPVDLDSYVLKNNLLSDDTDGILMKLHTPCPEMDPLVEISRSSELRHLLLHPVLASFVHLKWHHTKNFFYMNLAFWKLFVFLLTFAILQHYITSHQDHHLDPFCHSTHEITCFFIVAAHVLLAVSCVCLAVKIIFQLSLSPIHYLSNFNSYLQLILVVLAIVIVFRGWSGYGNAVSAVTLFLAWLQFFLMSGEHPSFSVYFYLFRKVCSSFLGYLMWYGMLLTAFSMSFHALFHNARTFIPERSITTRFFHNPVVAVFSTIGMSVGGFETKFLPFDSATGVSHIIFVLFTFLLTLVLLNILTGLAVNQTQHVQSNAKLVHLRAKVSVTSDIERLLLGNPLYIHLRMRRLHVSRNSFVTCVVKSSMYLWLMCNWLRWFRNLHRNVIIFSNWQYDHATILFPFGSDSSVTCDYDMDKNILKEAAEIVRNRDDGTKDLEERLIECQEMFGRYEERLENIEVSLRRTEALQNEMLQLLQALRE